MKQTSILILLCLLLASCLGSKDNKEQSTNKEIQKPNFTTSLKFLRKTYNFDTVRRDSILSAVFPIVNTGKNKLVIYSIRPDCNCTEYHLSKDTIIPQDTGFVQLTLNTYNKQGETKSYTIMEANTNTGIYKLTLKGFVVD